MAKEPEDHQPARHPKSEKFSYTLDNGQTIEADFVENVPYKAIKQFGTMEDSEAQDNLLQTIMSADDYATFEDNISLGEFQEFFERWQDESSMKLGEI